MVFKLSFDYLYSLDSIFKIKILGKFDSMFVELEQFVVSHVAVNSKFTVSRRDGYEDKAECTQVSPSLFRVKTTFFTLVLIFSSYQVLKFW